MLFFSGKNIKEIETLTNEELEKNNYWLISNKLYLNINKTKYLLFHRNHSDKSRLEDTITITINNQKIERVKIIKCLGITLDDKPVTWLPHVNEKAIQLSKTIGIMNKLKMACPPMY